MLSLDNATFWRKIFEDLSKISIVENPPEVEKSAGDIYLGTIKSEVIKKISIYLNALGEEMEELEDLEYKIDEKKDVKDLPKEDIEVLKKIKDLEGRMNLLEFLSKKLMEEELGEETRCTCSCIIKGWEVVKPHCEKCNYKSKCLDATYAYEGLEKAFKESDKLSSLKITHKTKLKRSSN
jgi:hypothetical protein